MLCAKIASDYLYVYMYIVLYSYILGGASASLSVDFQKLFETIC